MDLLYFPECEWDSAKYVQLIFSKQATVIYDPNGGTYNGTSGDTEIKMASAATDESDGYESWTNSESAVSPDADKIKFIGWFCKRRTERGRYKYRRFDKIRAYSSL